MMVPLALVLSWAVFCFPFTSALDDFDFSGWGSTCNACAPVQNLQANAFGIEISPDYITLSMRFPNGTAHGLVSVETECDFWMTMIKFASSANHFCANQKAGLKKSMERHERSEIMAKGLRQLVAEKERLYPQVGLEYGSASIPAFAFSDPVIHGMVQRAFDLARIRNPSNAEYFNIYATDLASASAVGALDGEKPSNFYDALVVDNTTSSGLYFSWYTMKIIGLSTGRVAVQNIELPHRCSLYPPDFQSRKEKPATPIHPFIRDYIEQDSNPSGISSGLSKLLTSSDTKLILRLSSSSDDEIHDFAKQINTVLKGTRFDPSNPKTTVYRDEGTDWLYNPASWVANQTKAQLDAPLPKGCSNPHPVCEDLKECVRQEALGDLIICEDIKVPEPSFWERVETGAENGMWNFYRDNLYSWMYLWTNEIEALLWLGVCSPSMPWSGFVDGKCSEAIVKREDGGKGVLARHVGLTSSISYSVMRYWTGGRLSAFVYVPWSWFGWENFLKVVTWGVSKIVGRENFETLVENFADMWESNLKELFESVMGKEILD
ncbi:hypothetical protein BDV96DRAFT_589754 [Lophiotrema nucula]|uniref:Uncharacterized protein n=1 Tax=Lophiotrema nucula TaxID=690887 RepID=A0A6A5YJ71_9PLEO|nr:hypothetical protein BDV96DRAFT_589754 [Lophiotrema nucula]